MNKIDKKTVIFGIIVLGVTVIPLSGTIIYKQLQNNNVSQNEYAESSVKEEKEETVPNEEKEDSKEITEENIEKKSQETKGEKKERASPNDGNENTNKKPHKKKGEKIEEDNKDTQNN